MTKILIDEAVVMDAQMYFNMIATGANLDWIKHQAGQQAEALRKARADAALDKMADNARELGLTYDAPVAQIDTSPGRVEKEAENKDVRPPNCGTGYCSCIECLFEQPAPAQQCVCGEPETSGTHRTDGPCYAEQPAPAQPLTDEFIQSVWHKVWPESGSFVRVSADDLRRFAHGITKGGAA